jgi:Tfp pilus assembly protein PilO
LIFVGTKEDEVKINNRQQLLMIGAIAVVGLFVADKLLITPLAQLWKDRSKAITELGDKVARGKNLQDREHALRSDWQRMRTNTLPTDESLAEEQVLKAFRKWERDSRVTITSISPQSKHDSDEYTTIQCRIEASGTIDNMNHFLYDLEKDPMALKLELVELSSHDTEGQQLLLGLQVSGLILTPRAQKQ